MLEGWGRLGVPGVETLAEDLAVASRGAVLSRGLGRSYGDSSLPAAATDKVLGTRLADRILAFDEATGRIRVEAGVCLAELNRVFLTRGWFTPVTPGTKFVTVGGMVASDVHGKNHHVAGCFGEHVTEVVLRLADDSVVACGPDERPDLFDATLGGMGLTGHILEIEFAMERVTSSWIAGESWRVPGIDAFLESLEDGARRFPMTVGWIDCVSQGRAMGRGIMNAGRWATAGEAPASPPREGPKVAFPFDLPNFAMNPLTVHAFNVLYYWRHIQKLKRGILGPEPFFYPLDSILRWNRAYGTRGFTQYQCVLPRAAGGQGVRDFMKLLTKLGGASPLCVIKDCGPEGRGLLSFPLEGTSIAVDLYVTPDIQRVVDELNAFVIAAKGRIYLTKDRFTRPEHFRAMEPRLERFLAVREKYDPHRRIHSAQSVRLFGDRP